MKTLLAALIAFNLAAGLQAKAKAEAQTEAQAKNRALREAHIKEKAKKMKAAKAAHWTCPMHPEVDQPNPGACPKCHMDLVKK